MLHQKETHNYVTQKPIIQPGVKLESKLKRYICKRCGMEFRNAFLLTNHRNQQVVSGIRKKCEIKNQTCHEIKMDGDASSLFKQDQAGLWECPQCDYKVKTKFLMSKHLK